MDYFIGFLKCAFSMRIAHLIYVFLLTLQIFFFLFCNLFSSFPFFFLFFFPYKAK